MSSLRRTLLAVLVPLVAVLLAAPAGPASAVRPAPSAHAKASIPRTYDAALAHFRKAPGVVRQYKRFLTPSGNIYCAVKVRFIPTGCEINEGAVKDPDVCSGNPVSQYVGRIEFHGGHAVPVCNTDTIRTPGAPTLEYGDIARKGGYACLSEAIGVTCINLNEADGFFLHRGEYVTFNAG
jgi:hypothetical protein